MPATKISNKKTIQPVMKGRPVSTNAGVLALYKKRVLRIVKLMTDETTKKVVKFFKKDYVDDYFNKQEELDQDQKIKVMDAKSPSSQARIMLAEIEAKFKRLFDDKGKGYTEMMLTSANKNNLSSVKSSLKQLTGLNLKLGLSPTAVSEELKSAALWSASLISDIADQYYTDIAGVISRSLSSGGALDIQEEMLKYGGVTTRRARNIAEDQTRKAWNNLNEQRFKSAGVTEFIWNHSSAGQTPRPDHVAMDGNIYSFDNLPVIDQRTGERGIPGQAINCRCYMTPVIKLNEEEEEQLKDAA